MYGKPCMGGDGKIIEGNIIKRRWVEIQYLGLSKVEGIENPGSEHESKKKKKKKRNKKKPEKSYC